MLVDRVRAVLHEGADGRGRRVELCHLVRLHHVPVARRVRVERSGLEHERGPAIAQRTIHDVRVARDPAAVSHASIDVALAVVEDVLLGHRGVEEVARLGVGDALRLPRGTRRVEVEEGVLAVHGLGRAVRAGVSAELFHPDVAPGDEVDVGVGALETEDVFDEPRPAGGGRNGGDGVIGDLLEGDDAAAAHAAVGSDDPVGVAVDNAAAKGLSGKAGKDDRVRGTDAGAGKHRVGALRDHREVYGDAVAALDAGLGEDLGDAADLAQELRVGDLLVVARLVGLPDNGGLVAAAVYVRM